MTKRELRTEVAVLREEVAALRRERERLFAVLGNAALDPQLRITAVALVFGVREQDGPDGYARLDFAELASRAGTTPEVVREQLAKMATWELLELQERSA